MRVNKSINEVFRSGEFENKQFAIKTSAQAFEILSSGLYKHKIRAIVRELSCNAYDSHVDAGKPDEPFFVHLPTGIEPWFLIRDYGIGLCHDDVMNLYTTYFGSNKTSSNNLVGCFGLGSKSPFAYTDTFTVVSYFNGVKRTYAAIVAEEGHPTINKMTEEKTDEPNGLEVSFPVKETDYNEFVNSACYVFSFFNTTPKINIPNLDLDQLNTYYNVRFESDNWKLYEPNANNVSDHVWNMPNMPARQAHYGSGLIGTGTGHGVYFVMGNVAYFVNLGTFGTEVYKPRNNLLVFYCPIGSFDITPSREDISLTEKSKAFLEKAATQYNEELPKKFEDAIQSATCPFEARKTLHSIMSDFGNRAFTNYHNRHHVSGLSHYVQNCSNPTKETYHWKGQAIEVFPEVSFTEWNIKVKHLAVVYYDYSSRSSNNYCLSALHPAQGLRGSTSMFTRDNHVLYRYGKEKQKLSDFKAYLRKHGQFPKVKEEYADNITGTFIDEDAPRNIRTINGGFFLICGKEETLNKLVKEKFGIPLEQAPFLDKFDFPKVGKQKIQTKSEEEEEVEFYNLFFGPANMKDCWRRTSEVGIDSIDKIYIPMSGHYVVSDVRDKINPKEISKLVKTFYHFTTKELFDDLDEQAQHAQHLLTNNNIYGVKRKHVEKLGNGWHNFWDILEDFISFNNKNNMYQVAWRASQKYIYAAKLYNIILEMKNEGYDFSASIENNIDLVKLIRKYESFISLIREYSYFCTDRRNRIDLKLGKISRGNLDDELVERYPMLKYAHFKFRDSSEKDKKTIKNYIKLVDKTYNM